MKHKFKAKLTGHGPKLAWVYMDIPAAVTKSFGTKARVPVVGTLNGAPFQNSLMPDGDGAHWMHVKKELQAQAKAGPGDSVSVVLERDDSVRKVKPPADLVRALAAQPALKKTFSNFPYSHQKEIVDWIVEAKKPETRERRIVKAMAMLAAKQPREAAG